MSPSLLEVRGITKRFGPTVALDGVDLTLAPGEVHAVIGENGAGKTTVMQVLGGALQPDAGAMSIAGQAYRPTSPNDARRSRITLIHQELSLCPHLTVAENILMGAEPSRMGWIDRDRLRAQTRELLAEFGRPEIDPDARVATLSLASRQVVEICRAIAADAHIVLMDEPTSSLQRSDVERLFTLIRRLSARGVGVMYISHFLDEVREVADRYTVLRDGRAVDGGALAGVDNDHLISQMIGRSMSGFFPVRRAKTVGEVVLQVRDLSAPPGLLDASLVLRAGEVMGIAGLVGSGRTELLRALFALGDTRSGSLVVSGQSTQVRSARPSRRLREGFGYLSEDRKIEGLALPLSVADNLTMTGMRAVAGRLGWLDLRRQRDVSRNWIERLGIRARSPRQAVGTLSGGNQQKVALGRLLHQDARILLLDEPTRGIDVGSKAQIYEIISRCAGEGKAVLMVSSELTELFALCDRLAVMRRGRLSETRPIDAWTVDEVMERALGSLP